MPPALAGTVTSTPAPLSEKDEWRQQRDQEGIEELQLGNLSYHAALPGNRIITA